MMTHLQMADRLRTGIIKTTRERGDPLRAARCGSSPADVCGRRLSLAKSLPSPEKKDAARCTIRYIEYAPPLAAA